MNSERQRYALLSVFDKQNIEVFAEGLIDEGFALVASDGTAKYLEKFAVPATTIQDFVTSCRRRRWIRLTIAGGEHFGERLLTDDQIDGILKYEGLPKLGHRVVTLQEEVHAALIAKYSTEHAAELDAICVPYIDLACVDFYPLDQAINDGKSVEEVIEATDIGGPTMLRSAAKAGRIVICDVDDRGTILDWIRAGEPNRFDMIRQLRAKVEFTVAKYCFASAKFHGQGEYDGQLGRLVRVLKYGENPHQTSALYTTDSDDRLGIPNFEQVAGQIPSYIGVTDVERALGTAVHIAAAFDVNDREVPYLGVIVKHGNATGAAVSADSPSDVIRKVIEANPGDSFGGVALFNFAFDLELANLMRRHLIPTGENARMIDGIVAPSFTPDAIERLRRKSDDKCRILVNPALKQLGMWSLVMEQRIRSLRGGFLMQTPSMFAPRLEHSGGMESYGVMNKEGENDLLLAWAVGSSSNSNTIVLARDGMTLAVAVGQQSRVGAAKLAVDRAQAVGHDTGGASAYSDSFFPFPDGPQVLIDAGVWAMFMTRGSKRDAEVFDVLQKADIAYWTVPDTVGRGFYAH